MFDYYFMWINKLSYNLMIDRIFLLTDLGLRDYYIAAMKNAILRVNPNIKNIIDITHEVSPWNIIEGSFILWQIIRELEEAIVIGVVDPGVGGSRRDIVIECDKQVYLVGPDNGLFYPGAVEKGIRRVWVIDISNKRYFPKISPTFYGRDVYAKAGGYLSRGVKEFLLDISVDSLVKINIFDAKVYDERIIGRVIHIDRFGNVILNIQCGILDNVHSLKLMIHGEKMDIKRVDYFAQLKQGDIGLICGSSGVYEIVSNLAKAAEILNAKVGDEIIIIHE
jgi:hypothetical protein